jgi:hypothetical protein
MARVEPVARFMLKKLTLASVVINTVEAFADPQTANAVPMRNRLKSMLYSIKPVLRLLTGDIVHSLKALIYMQYLSHNKKVFNNNA